MKKLWQEYHLPQTIEEAADLLSSYAGAARIIAGGTDLLLEMEQSYTSPVRALIDITRIMSLLAIQQEDGYITVGAGVTHADIVGSTLLAKHATCLVESCGVIGGPQVRNVATLGGNVAHALPAADGTTSLMALDAEAEVLYDGQRQWLGLSSLFLGPGQSLLDSTRDILLTFRFRQSQEREGSTFKRIMRPQGVALPILGCAVWLRLEDDELTIADIRICIGPMGPVATRIGSVEDAVRGAKLSEETLDEAVGVARASLEPRASKYRATAEYRLEMVETLLRRTLPLALERARTGRVVLEGIGWA